MKNIFSSLFLLIASVASAQITITSPAFMETGGIYYLASDSSSTNTYTAGSAGASQTWDYTDFNANTFDTTEIVAASSTEFAGLFPGANMAVHPYNDSVFSFYNVTAEGMFLHGLASNAVGEEAGLTFQFSPPVKELKFPMTYQDTIHTHRRFEIAASGEDIGLPVDSFRIRISEDVVKEVDAWGQLQLSYGNFSVLRIKESGTSTNVTETKFLGVWTEAESSTEQILNYTYQSADVALPMLTLNMDAETNSVTFAQILLDGTVGIDRTSAGTLSLYPNPVSDVLTISNDSKGKTTLNVFDITGKLLETHQLLNNVEQLSVGHLSEGAYLVSLTDENGTVRTQRFIKN